MLFQKIFHVKTLNFYRWMLSRGGYLSYPMEGLVLLCSIRSNQKWCKRKCSSLESQNCFFVYTIIIDYILTVAVSISSSTAALVSAFPSWGNYKVAISLLCVAFITLINLRGAREASKIFGLPTYIFIFSMIALIATGFFKFVTGSLTPISYSTPILPAETVQ